MPVYTFVQTTTPCDFRFWCSCGRPPAPPKSPIHARPPSSPPPPPAHEPAARGYRQRLPPRVPCSCAGAYGTRSPKKSPATVTRAAGPGTSEAPTASWLVDRQSRHTAAIQSVIPVARGVRPPVRLGRRWQQYRTGTSFLPRPSSSRESRESGRDATPDRGTPRASPEPRSQTVSAAGPLAATRAPRDAKELPATKVPPTTPQQGRHKGWGWR